MSVDPDGAPAGGAVAFTVAWEDKQGSNPPTIRVAGFTGPANRAYEITASQTTGTHQKPDVAVSASGTAMVVWEEDSDGTLGVWTRSFNAGGTALHSDVEVAAGGRAPGIGMDEQGGAAVVWTANQDTFIRGLNSDGTDTSRLASQPLMRVSGGRQEGIVVAVSPYGEVSVSYTDDNDGNGWDQIYLGLGILNSSW